MSSCDFKYIVILSSVILYSVTTPLTDLVFSLYIDFGSVFIPIIVITILIINNM